MSKKTSELKTYLIIPDTHIPYHDERAFTLMLKAVEQLDLYGIIILGDFGDFYAVSSHSKDPKRKTMFEWEIQQVRAGLDRLDALKVKHKVFVEGNHEDRLLRYLKDVAPALHDTISTSKLLQLETRKWEFVPYKSDYQLGKISITHDTGTAGRYAAYKCLDVYQHSNITGHTHRLAYVVEGNARGEHKISAQFGWLGNVEEIDYMHKASAKKNWALGFGLVHLHEATGIGYVVPIPIVNYTCCINGKLIKG